MIANILIGLPAASKTTFYAIKFVNNEKHISLDLLKSRSKENKIVKECIQLRQRFVVDNTNVTRAERMRYISDAKDAGYRIYGYYFPVSVKEAVSRNCELDLAKRVPTVGIYSIAKRLEPPVKEEGFDSLFIVNQDDNGTFIVTEVEAVTK